MIKRDNTIRKVLIANRGEIAVRIIRACKELGIKTVAAYSEEDKYSLTTDLADEAICIGRASAKESYLNIPNIISACDVTGADSIHPGVGFLSEDPNFARICEDCNITFIGPSSETISMMGDKSRAKKIMRSLNIPTIPGSDGEINSVEEALIIANKIGYPVMIKASFGGGGKGIRIANSDEELKKEYYVSRLESKACFHSESVYIEKIIRSPKHIEFQIIADKYGNVVHLGERDCSMQRNNQKVIEESPCNYISEKLRRDMGEVAIKVAKSVGYVSAGTVEFLLDEDNNYYFMEMNTRIQVEHPITEVITGIDLVKEQINVASGKRLYFTQEEVSLSGHAIECRINAEDTKNGFAPCSGKIGTLILPGGTGIRVDSCIYSDCNVSPYYDSMIAKIIAHGRDRNESIKRMVRALEELRIDNIITNKNFQSWLLEQEEFLNGSYNTEFLSNKLVSVNEFVK
ncbi:acetyl-CoA carboxylase biotin carboxylase subunit [Clostridium sp. C8-1-8]|uniref:acetyl-CoA carboxylase biotin carboxylase subunit n=1 Tax=Clostridium sp. C8-1-8 TaxID=2698831 RepID=UPI001FAD7940|nr:acetyl-CoA carboxylase biotin carboxylase subunit [Clostridium sp. C8-1-8]